MSQFEKDAGLSAESVSLGVRNTKNAKMKFAR